MRDKNDEPETEQGATIKDAFKTRAFWIVNIGEVLRMGTVMAVITHAIPYLSSVGLARTRSGLVAGAIPILSIAGRLSFGWLTDCLSKKKGLIIAFLFMCIGMLAFAYVPACWAVAAFILFFPIGYGGGITSRSVILRDYYGRELFGKAIGIVMGISALGAIFGPVSAGWIYDRTGAYFFIWIILFILSLVGVILAMFLRRP